MRLAELNQTDQREEEEDIEEKEENCWDLYNHKVDLIEELMGE